VYGTNGVGARRLWALVSSLPPDSALARAVAPWRLEDELLATLIEVVDAGNRQVFQAVLAPYVKSPEAWEQIRVPRPGTTAPPAPKPKSVAEIRAMFETEGGDDE
jgi:hypothetical protein